MFADVVDIFALEFRVFKTQLIETIIFLKDA